MRWNQMAVKSNIFFHGEKNANFFVTSNFVMKKKIHTVQVKF